MKRHVHYEMAFQDYLQQSCVPYVAVDEAKKASFRDAKLKSFDFIVYAASQANWLTDIKGRRWTRRKGARRPALENWVTQDDLDGLLQWQRIFGDGFRALLVFAYWLDEACLQTDGWAPPPELVHVYRGAQYLFAGIPADDYRENARVRSPKWGTVNVPTRDFAERVEPFELLLT